MSEASKEALSAQSVFRIIRIIKPPSTQSQTAMNLVGLLMTAAANPATIPLVAIPLLIAQLRQYYQPNLGEIILPSDIHRPWEYADKVRRLTLERLYGTEKGDIVWNHEWSQRAIEIDYRSRAP